ncbi:MAG: hypothetical protein KTR32_16570 [Granulosicoccus sp.]|nr:hypothetical protein [Granulosicoccus sp.]
MNPVKYRFFSAVALALSFLITGSAKAEINTCEWSVSATFDEGAPRDYFHISNESTGPWAISAFNLDLEPSAGQLIFDTEAGGKGVEVFQLFDAEPGSVTMKEGKIPNDGDTELQLSFNGFAAGETFSFSIDVDDQLVDSALGQIRVSGSEMAGSVMQIKMVNDRGEQRTQQLRFNDKNKSVIEVSGC